MKFAIPITRTAIRALPATMLVLAATSPGGSVFGQNMERSFTVAEGDWLVLNVECAHISVTSTDHTEFALFAERA